LENPGGLSEKLRQPEMMNRVEAQDSLGNARPKREAMRVACHGQNITEGQPAPGPGKDPNHAQLTVDSNDARFQLARSCELEEKRNEVPACADAGADDGCTLGQGPQAHQGELKHGTLEGTKAIVVTTYAREVRASGRVGCLPWGRAHRFVSIGDVGAIWDHMRCLAPEIIHGASFSLYTST
jgi:hypothetical protein